MRNAGLVFGGAKRDRTADLLHAMQALSQLSYSPKFCLGFVLKRGALYAAVGGVSRKKPLLTPIIYKRIKWLTISLLRLAWLTLLFS